MIANVRARYANGSLVPLEPLELEEGAEVMLSIDDVPTPRRPQESIPDMLERLRKTAPRETWDGFPTDGAKNRKYYLYGHPKEAE